MRRRQAALTVRRWKFEFSVDQFEVRDHYSWFDAFDVLQEAAVTFREDHERWADARILLKHAH